VEAEAKVGYYRLRCNDEWKPKSKGFGHAYMIQDIEKEPILQIGSDKIIPKHVYDKPLMIRFPNRSEWKERGLISYTDGSKTNKGTGAGVYCDGTRRKHTFSLGTTTNPSYNWPDLTEYN
jgi:hypothetical protein